MVWGRRVFVTLLISIPHISSSIYLPILLIKVFHFLNQGKTVPTKLHTKQLATLTQPVDLPLLYFIGYEAQNPLLAQQRDSDRPISQRL